LPHPKADDAPIVTTASKTASKILKLLIIKLLLYERPVGLFRTEHQEANQDVLPEESATTCHPLTYAAKTASSLFGLIIYDPEVDDSVALAE
jgi:hypothetical protein